MAVEAIRTLWMYCTCIHFTVLVANVRGCTVHAPLGNVHVHVHLHLDVYMYMYMYIYACTYTHVCVTLMLSSLQTKAEFNESYFRALEEFNTPDNPFFNNETTAHAYVTFTYDAVWTMALAMDSAEADLRYLYTVCLGVRGSHMCMYMCSTTVCIICSLCVMWSCTVPLYEYDFTRTHTHTHTHTQEYGSFPQKFYI